MDSELTTVALAAPGRLIGAAADGTLRLVWGEAAFRLPIYDLPHLAAAIDAWCADEEPPPLRRGYYRVCHSPEGGVQLWMSGAGLLLSRDELRTLGALVEEAARELCVPLCRQPRLPFGLGYRPMQAPVPGPHRFN
jgi:hypothetical protein